MPKGRQLFSYSYSDSDSGRHKRILAEVDSLDADIVTLQEIEYDYYHKDLQAAMDSLGYAGVHHLRFVCVVYLSPTLRSIVSGSII